MPTVLVISPRFPPINAPDLHRVRQGLLYFEEFGWEPEVLAVDPAYVERPRDPALLDSVPDHISVHRVGALDPSWTRRIGLGSLALRSLPFYLLHGSRYLSREDPDLIYFSTTAFPVMALGPLWKRWYGIPYVIDLQDPWVTDYYNRPAAPSPPGGRFKHGVHQAIAKVLEPPTVREASHLVCASPAYPKTLASRYAGVNQDRCTVLPFGAPERDFELLSEWSVSQEVFDPEDDCEHWVYVGAYVRQMEISLHPLLRAFGRARRNQPERFRGVRIQLIGTGAGKANACSSIRRIAEREGVADAVHHHPERVPYFVALRCMKDADVLFILGSDDAGYTPSKLCPYILARNPLLTVSHEASSLVDVVEEVGAGVSITFSDRSTIEEVSSAIESEWIRKESVPEPNTDWELFEKYTARERTREQCRIFDECAAGAGGQA